MLRLGVDLGGTKIEAIAMDVAGLELGRLRMPTPRGDYEGTVAAVAKLVRRLEEQFGERGTVGLGIPGTIVADTQLVKNANSVWLNGRPLQRDLSVAMDREVRCANDANCFAVSEATDGAAQGQDVVFGVILGTGCGGGLVLRGKLHSGLNGLAGEWGHTPLPWPGADETPGRSCYCGRSGCLETWISGTAFEQDFAQRAGIQLGAREIMQSARAGNGAAAGAFSRLKDRMARGLAVVVNLLDPDMIVFGGGLSNIDELYTGELEMLLARYTFGGGTRTPIVKSRHGDSSGVRGAAWLWPADEAKSG